MGNITSITREMGTFTYSHDDTDQLTSVNGPAALGALVDNRSWSFDGTGNRTNDSVLGAGSSVNNVITQLGGRSYASDVDGWGNITRISGHQNTIGDSRFTYRADGQITAFTKSIGSGGSRIDTNAIYAIDALGRRIAKSVTIDVGAPIKQSYAFLGNEDKILLGRKGDGAVQLMIDGAGIDEHLAMVDSSGVKVAVTDHLGSVLNGIVAGVSLSYSSWGEPLSSITAISASSDAVVYGLGGGTYNLESGTITFGLRELDLSSGAWISHDVLGFAAGDVNLRRYVFNNPNQYTDPSGAFVPLALAVSYIGYSALVGGIVSGVAYLVQTPQKQFTAQDFLVSVGTGALGGSLIGLGAATGTVAGLAIGTAIGLAAETITATQVLGTDYPQGLVDFFSRKKQLEGQIQSGGAGRSCP